MTTLACPVCQNLLTLTDKTYRCVNNHSFDVAKEGYVNLHIVQHKHSKNPGDTPASLQARRRFLSQDFYAPLALTIKDLLDTYGISQALDIGCGEGYYTQYFVSDKRHMMGIDIAKSAVQLASKIHKNNITWVVGTASRLPVMTNSVECCISIFSPITADEISRVLQDNGYLMVATPDTHHLYTLRQALFGDVILHNPTKAVTHLKGFKLIDTVQVSTDLSLDNQSLKDLVAMTPYAYKAKPYNIQDLMTKQRFATDAKFCVLVFKKLTA